MDVLLLGTTGYHPNDRRHTACMMLPELGLVLDAGTALYRVRDFIQTKTLDIFLTHAHLDHVIGLTFLFDVLWQQEMDHVLVHAEPEKVAAVQEHLFSPLLFPVQPPFEWRELSGSIELSHGAKLHYFPLKHPGGSIGYRLEVEGKSMAYVTDTTASLDAAYLEHIRDVDLLIHECYFPDGWEEHAELTGHSCVTPVAEVAKAVNAKKLVLVHVNPLSPDADPVGCDTARAIFPNTVLGEDGMKLEL